LVCFDIAANQAAFQELQERGYIRYIIAAGNQGRQMAEVEFVSNVYQVDQSQIIQCNIRDITESSRLERQAFEQAEALADLHRRKDEFLAIVSHELPQSSTPILNAMHILRVHGSENPIQQQARSIIERQVGQLARLVDTCWKFPVLAPEESTSPGTPGHQSIVERLWSRCAL